MALNTSRANLQTITIIGAGAAILTLIGFLLMKSDRKKPRRKSSKSSSSHTTSITSISNLEINEDAKLGENNKIENGIDFKLGLDNTTMTTTTTTKMTNKLDGLDNSYLNNPNKEDKEEDRKREEINLDKIETVKLKPTNKIVTTTKQNMNSIESNEVVRDMVNECHDDHVVPNLENPSQRVESNVLPQMNNLDKPMDNNQIQQTLCSNCKLNNCSSEESSMNSPNETSQNLNNNSFTARPPIYSSTFDNLSSITSNPSQCEQTSSLDHHHHHHEQQVIGLNGVISNSESDKHSDTSSDSGNGLSENLHMLKDDELDEFEVDSDCNHNHDQIELAENQNECNNNSSDKQSSYKVIIDENLLKTETTKIGIKQTNKQKTMKEEEGCCNDHQVVPCDMNKRINDKESKNQTISASHQNVKSVQKKSPSIPPQKSAVPNGVHSSTSSSSSSASPSPPTSKNFKRLNNNNNKKYTPEKETPGSLTIINHKKTETITNMSAKSSIKSNKSESSDDSLLSSSSCEHAPFQDLVVYEFNFPRKYCGKLIGKNGVHVDYIRSKTRTQIAVRNDPHLEELQIVCVSGKLEDVDQALDIISNRFPVKHYPQISFKPISKPIVYRRYNPEKTLFNEAKVLVAPNMFVEFTSVIESSNNTAASNTNSKQLATNQLFNVHVTAVVSAAHVFVQLPTHPTYLSLQKLDESMLSVYSNMNEPVPQMIEPIEYGTICVAPTSYGWHRAMVTSYQSLEETLQQIPDFNENCGLATVKFLDYGGYLTIPANQLRQLRSDFMLLPFQAVECYLDGVFPYEGIEEEGKNFLSQLIKNSNLQAMVTGTADDGIPLIKLFISNDTYQNCCVNDELCNFGFVFNINNENYTENNINNSSNNNNNTNSLINSNNTSLNESY